MSKPATLVVTATSNPDEKEAIQSYLQGVMPLLLQAGGKLVKRLKVAQLIGGKPIGMVLVMDFDSDEAITTLFSSAEYAALIPIRDKAFSEINLFLTHEM